MCQVFRAQLSLGVNKFDNVVTEAIQGTNTILFKGFCSAVF